MSGPFGAVRQDAGDTVGDPGDARPRRRAPVRPDVHVDEPGPVRRGDRQLARQHADRSLEEVVVRAGQVHEVGRVDGERPESQLRDPRPERRELGGELRAAAPRGRVVGEDLEAVGADRVGTLDGADHPGPQGEVRPQAAAAGQRGTRLSGRPRRRARARLQRGRGERGRGCRTSGGHLPDRTGARARCESPAGPRSVPTSARSCRVRAPRPARRTRSGARRSARRALSGPGAPCSTCTRRRRSARSARSRRHGAGRAR